MQSVKQDRIPLLTLAIAALLLFSAGVPALAQDQEIQEQTVVTGEEEESVPALEDLRQQAMRLKQELLTATQDERTELSAEADQLLEKFDRRIAALEDQFAESREDMTETAQQYSLELMAVLTKRRDELQNWIAEFRENSEEAWDHLVYRLSSAYNSFYESWQDVEANLELEPG